MHLAPAPNVTGTRVESRRLDLSDEAIAESVLALQRESYAIEAALIADERIPMLTESLEGLRAAGLEWLGAFDPDGLAGAVSWMVLADDTVDIHRLVVAPRAFRRGVATALLDALDVAYRRRGFTLVREHEVTPGLFVAELGRAAS